MIEIKHQCKLQTTRALQQNPKRHNNSLETEFLF